MMKINSMLMTLMECIMVQSKVHTTQRGNSCTILIFNDIKQPHAMLLFEGIGHGGFSVGASETGTEPSNNFATHVIGTDTYGLGCLVFTCWSECGAQTPSPWNGQSRDDHTSPEQMVNKQDSRQLWLD